jgi:hypothetical protein
MILGQLYGNIPTKQGYRMGGFMSFRFYTVAGLYGRWVNNLERKIYELIG